MNKTRILSLILVLSLIFFGLSHAQSVSQTIALKSGFNFISFKLKPALSAQQLMSQSPGIAEIYSFNTSSGSFMTASEGTLITLNVGKGYIIRANADASIQIEGTTVNPIGDLNLKPGFNLVGISRAPETLKFSDIIKASPTVMGMYKWSPNSGSFITVTREPNGTPALIDGIDPTLAEAQSYFFNLSGAMTLNYDGGKFTFNGTAHTRTLTNILLSKISDNMFGSASYDLSKIVVNAQYSDLSNALLNAVQWSITSGGGSLSGNIYTAPNAPGNVVLTAVYSENGIVKTAPFTLTVAPSKTLSGITLSTSSVSLETNSRISLPSIIKVTANYSDSSSAEVSLQTTWEIASGTGAITGAEFAAPSKQETDTIVATYKENNQSYFAILTVKIVPATSTVEQVAAPVFNPGIDGTSFATNQLVTITCTTPGAGILYTLDGSTPSLTNGLTYGGTFTIIATTTIKAIAVKTGMKDSAVISATCTKIGQVAAPAFTPAAGTSFATDLQVTISCATTGATIKYTMDGSTPSAANGATYTAPVVLTNSATIKAIAIKSGLTDSTISTAAYSKNGQVAAPAFTPATGESFSVSQQVTISCATQGATIKYTTDGTVPSATNGSAYTAPVSLTATTTIKAIALINGMTDSTVASATYTKTGGTVLSGNTVSVDLGSGVLIEMIRIPAGTYQMGRGDTTYTNSVSGTTLPGIGPIHQVTISRDFYMGKYEVTQGQWKAVMGGANPSSYKLGDNYPVESVSWDDISNESTGFLARLNQLAPNGTTGYRLPTEAEWEYACRAGTSTYFYWGNDQHNSDTSTELYFKFIGDYAWYYENSTTGNSAPPYFMMHPVGLKPPNPWGLHDMSGNIAEWCSDWYDVYQAGAVTDPTGPAGTNAKILRGGAFYNGYESPRGGLCGSASRYQSVPTGRYSNTGFRLVLPAGQ